MMTNLASIIVVFLAFLTVIDGAQNCYSGQNDRYQSKQCSSGGFPGEYTCQKFVCEGGKSPFTLRTCARKNIGCIAGPRICQFSGGHGKCSRCDTDLCNNLAPFMIRACEVPGGDCEAGRKLCGDSDGNGTCYICQSDDCNSANTKNLFAVIFTVFCAFIIKNFV